MRINQFRPGKSIRVESPAKLNLILEVLSKRADGYHDIASVLCPIDLWDVLEIGLLDSSEVRLELRVPQGGHEQDSAWKIPNNEDNLVIKAAKLVRQATGESAGCRIKLEKLIPASAGLGGGSGNAAATIVGYLLLLNRWDRVLAGDLCQQLGSDLNFFLGTEQGFGLTKSEGRGEKTSLISHFPSLSFWLTHPSLGCSTAAVYSKVFKVENLKKLSEFVAACETGQNSKIGASLFNALQLPASELNPWIEVQMQLLQDCGCRYRQMTGSGSCCFGLRPESGLFEFLKTEAEARGVPRVYQSDIWYGPSIEQQLAQSMV